MATKFNYTMIRGDDNSLKVKLNGSQFAANDVLRMMVREDYDSDAVISKTASIVNGEAIFVLTNADTQDIEPGTYVYDIQVKWGTSGNVQTLIEKSAFKLREDITYD